MKILSLTPVGMNKELNQNRQYSGNLFINNTLKADTVSFKSGKKKAAAAAKDTVNNMFGGFLDNLGGDLGAKVKELMSNDISRPVFMTMLVSLAATATDLILNKNKNTGEVKEIVQPEDKSPVNDIEQPEDNTVEANDKADEASENTKKKRGIVTQMGEEAFVAKLQEMADKGYTLAQMGEELGGLSISSVSKYMKHYNIQKQASTETEAGNTAGKRKTKEEKLNEFINSKPYRQEYLKRLNDYPDLQQQYKAALANALENPKDKNAKDALEGMEKIFEHITGLKPKFCKNYLEKFNTQYGKVFDKTAIIFNNITPDKTLQEYLANFIANEYSEETLQKWVEYPAFTIDELNDTKELPKANREKIYMLKQKGNFSFELVKNDKYNNYAYLLHFKDNLELTKKLKTISNFHEALYDNIYLHKDRGNKVQRSVDIQEELQNNLTKDKNLDSIYNLLKFIAPDEMESINYQTDRYIPANEADKVNASVKRQMEEIIRNLDVKTNPRLHELESVINDNELFRDLIENNHAKLRFISRFVLNNKVKDNELYENCCFAIKNLEEDLNYKLENGCLIFPYTMNESSAPSFYLDKSVLGDYIKITLNNFGQIHTMFEDVKRKSNSKN